MVTLHSRVTWHNRRGRNLIARVRGTDPGFAPDRKEPEAVVVAAAYDSFGIVPELSPGARGAANVAALIELAGKLVANPPKRHMLLMFLDGQARAFQGAREVYSSLHLGRAEAEALESERRGELEHVRAMHQLLETDGLTFADAEPGPPALALRAGSIAPSRPKRATRETTCARSSRCCGWQVKTSAP